MRRLLLILGCSAIAGCSLTPIPDLTSEYSEPCESSARSCAREFKLKAGTEQKVELRGDFRTDGWIRGEPMSKAGENWSATVVVPWGANVQYKFFVDGATWVLDPANSTTGTTAGVTNSQVNNVTCAKWTCATQ